MEIKENEARRVQGIERGHMEEKEAMPVEKDDETLARLSVPRPCRPPAKGL